MGEKTGSTSDPSSAEQEDVTRRAISFKSGEETLAGDLVLPADLGPHPAILVVAGTGAQNRYGDMVLPDGEVLPHSRYRWMAKRLAQAGIASLYWDKRGVGESTGGDREPGDPPGDRDAYTSVMTDVEDAESALNFLASRAEIDADHVAVLGRSAGVYFSCLLAARTDRPAAYIMTGGVHMGIDAFMELVYERALAYAARGPEEEAWVEEHLSTFYAIARHWRQVLAAAQRGDDVYEGSREGVFVRRYLTRLKQELEYPLYDQFRHVQKPVLICHGDKDVNVPVQEAFKIAQELEDSGNPDVTLVIVPGADHSMRVGPPELDDETRFREKFDYNYDYPFSEFFIRAVIGWTLDRFRYLDAGS
jgi:dipeptidyl aminopeptidase/acylaminoacyl peptidase